MKITLLLLAALLAGKVVKIDDVTDEERVLIWELAQQEQIISAVGDWQQERRRKIALELRRRDKRLWSVGVIAQVLADPRPLSKIEQAEQERQVETVRNQERERDEAEAARDQKSARGEIEQSFDPFSQRPILWWNGTFKSNADVFDLRTNGTVRFGKVMIAEKTPFLSLEVVARHKGRDLFVEEEAGKGTPVAFVSGGRAELVGLAEVFPLEVRGVTLWQRVSLRLAPGDVQRLVQFLGDADHAISLRAGLVEVDLSNPVRRQALAEFLTLNSDLPHPQPGQKPADEASTGKGD